MEQGEASENANWYRRLLNQTYSLSTQTLGSIRGSIIHKILKN